MEFARKILVIVRHSIGCIRHASAAAAACNDHASCEAVPYSQETGMLQSGKCTEHSFLILLGDYFSGCSFRLLISNSVGKWSENASYVQRN